MKYASSIKYGGQLVDAIECDYDDYKRLGLLCPECKDPVFLRAGGTRMQRGKEVKVGAYFSHFATKDPEQAKVCENRVKGYTQADIDRAIAKARGQRLKLLQRWFWDVFTKKGCLDKACADRLHEYRHDFKSKGHRTGGIIGETHLEVFKGINSLDGVLKKLRDTVNSLQNPGDSQLNAILLDLEDVLKCHEGCSKIGGMDIDEFVCQSWFPFSLSSIQFEVIEFLLAFRQRPILLEICQKWEMVLTAIAMTEDSRCRDAIDPATIECIDGHFGWGLEYEDWLKEMVESEVSRLLFADIVSIPWADEFAKLEKPIAPNLEVCHAQ